MARRAVQLSLPGPKTWGGRRPGAGRKLTPGRRPGMPHRPRLPHRAAHPVHVTLRAMSAIRCLRADKVFPRLRHALIAASHSGFRIIHYSVQDDHIHLIIEADDGSRLSRGMRGLAIRIARAVNGALGRRGTVWDSRYHCRALSTPRAVRHAIVYVLMNFKKHGTRGGRIDPCSSGAWFDGWRTRLGTEPSAPSPVRRAQSWLAAVGWRRYGLIDFQEHPRPYRRFALSRGTTSARV